MNKCIRKTNEQFVSGLRKVRLLETMSYIVLLAMVVGEADRFAVGTGAGPAFTVTATLSLALPPMPLQEIV